MFILYNTYRIIQKCIIIYLYTIVETINYTTIIKIFMLYNIYIIFILLLLFIDNNHIRKLFS